MTGPRPRLPRPRHRRCGVPADRRGSIAIMTAAFLLPIMAIIGLVVDEGFWTIAATRLQIAADAAAMSASLTMATSAFRAETAANQLTTLRTVALFEANAAATKLIGTLQTPVGITYDGTNYTSVKVTLTTQPPAFFSQALNITAPTLSASATVSVPPVTPCLETLGSSAAAFGIKVDNAGSIIATGCSIFSDSPANPSIYLNSGTISATAIGAVGTVSKSNSGSNNMTPTPQSNQTAAGDPDAGKVAPTPGSCVTQQDYTAYGTWDLQPGTYCNGLTVGGNGSTVAFEPGIYIITNGNLTFTNANVTKAANVTFVLAGATPGNLVWTNNSSSVDITAPTTGTTAGFAFWLVCNSSSQSISIQGGGTMSVSGIIYAPCASADIGNNSTTLQPPSGGGLNLIASQIYAHGSGTLKLAPVTSGSSSTTMHLTN
jgi:Flp pilus assembly protein TadG